MPKLITLFHQDEQKCDELYNSLYSSPLSHHLNIPIRQLNSQREFPAFFYYTEELTQNIFTIMKDSMSLSLLAAKLPGIAIRSFQRSCLIEEIQSSNDIEGVRSTRKEISAALEEQANIQNADNTRLWSTVNKYVKLQQQEDIPFSNSQDLRLFYDSFIADEILRDDPQSLPDGKLFRKDSVDIWSKTRIIHHGVYPEEKIIEYMDHALKVLQHNDIPALVRVSIFHYLFGYIHPFYDGNGRTSRFITSYYLSKILHPLVAIRLSITIKKSLRTYYKLFEDTNSHANHGDLTPFITGFLWIIQKSVVRVNDILTEKANQLSIISNKLEKLSYTDKKLDSKIYFVLLQASLFSEDGATLEEIADTLNKNIKTIRNHIRTYPQKHIIINKTHRAHRFQLNINALAF